MNRFEWYCRYRWCKAHGSCETGLLAFAEWAWHEMVAHLEKP